MAHKNVAVIVLSIGIVICLAGIVASFFTPKGNPTWWSPLSKAMTVFGLLLIIVGTVFTAMIHEEKIHSA